MSIDTELFIEAIKLHPALYDKRVKEYADKSIKKKLWSELCSQLVEKWDELSDKEKYEKGDELQKRWRNLRTCFKRECAVQKNIMPGSGAKKRRKYIYFDQLLFLSDCIESTITSNSIQQNDSYKKNNEDEHAESQHMTVNTRADRMTKSTTRKTAPVSKSFEESVLDILKEKRNEDKEVDEDKYFLLSLLPSFKKFNEDQKFVARMQILNVMRQVRMSGSLATTMNPRHLDSAIWSGGNLTPPTSTCGQDPKHVT